MSHSQGGEEAVILEAVKHLDTGRWLDVGAGDGVCFSNSRALAELGWGGTAVECCPFTTGALTHRYADREDVNVVCGAMAVHDGVRQLHASHDGLLSTTDYVNMKKWEGETTFDIVYVPLFTPAQLFAALPGPYEFINIDTEGTSLDLFKVMLEMDLGTVCWCVEHDGHQIEMANRGREKGLGTKYLDGNNLIMARE